MPRPYNFIKMKYNQLGKSNLNVSSIGMGCWAIGGTKWGTVNDEESIKTIKKALELDINFFDTADFYGFGHSEELLGKVLKSKPDAIIATKVGLRWNNKGKIRHDLSQDYIKKACENSLNRLRREAIDLYQIHWPDPETDLSITIKTLDELVREGKARYVGASNLKIDQIKILSKYPWFISYQGPFNLFNQEVKKEILPYCYKQKIGFIAYEPLLKGILTGKFKQIPPFNKGDHRKYEKCFTSEFSYYKEKMDLLSNVALKYKITETQMALALLLKNKGVITVIPGAKTTDQVEENVKAIEINKDLVAKLNEEVKRIFNTNA